MQTVQRNFAESLLSSPMSMRKKFLEVKQFSYKKPRVEKFHSMTVEHVELPLEVKDGIRDVLVATMSTPNTGGKAVYNLGIEPVKLF